MRRPPPPLHRHSSRGTAAVFPVALILLGVLTLAGCEKDAVELIPATGVIEVTALTEGPGVYPDSLEISINGGSSGFVPPNGVKTLSNLPRGRYLVALSENDDNCFYAGNSREVTVSLNDTTFVTFLVRCR